MLRVQRACILLLFPVAAASLISCGGSSSQGPTSNPPPSFSTGSLVVFGQDAPLDDLVKFEISVTSVVLNPGGVTALSDPVRVELTSLQLDKDLIELAENVPTGTYTNLTISFADPEIKLRNPATGEITTVEPPLQSASVTVNLTFSVVTDQATGLLVDFDLQASVQTDAAENITGVNPVLTVELVSLDAQAGELEDVPGRVVSVNRTDSTSGTFVLEVFPTCVQLNVTVDPSTVFEDFPAPADFDSVKADQIVEIDADVQADGTLLLEKVELENELMEEEIEGLIVQVTRDDFGQVTDFKVVPLAFFSCTGTPPAADTITVSFSTDPATEFRIDDEGLPVNSSLFDEPADLGRGQDVEVDPLEPFAPDTTTVTAERIKLSDQTIRGTASAPSVTTFQLIPNSTLFPDSSITVETSVETEFDDLPNGVGSLSEGQAVRVRGLLFRSFSGELILVAERVDGTP